MEQDLHEILVRCQTILRRDKEDASLNDALRIKLTGTYPLYFKNRGGIEGDYEEPQHMPFNTRIRMKPCLVLDPEVEARRKPLPNDTITHTPPEEREELPPEVVREIDNGVSKDNEERFYIKKEVPIKEQREEKREEEEDQPVMIGGLIMPKPPVPYEGPVSKRYKLRDDK